MVAPVIAGLSRIVVSFARSSAGKQFLKRLKDAGKNPAERKSLLTAEVQKSFRDSPGIRQRLISLEQGDIKELSKAEILAKKIAEKKAGKKEDPWDFVQRTGDKPKPNEQVVKWDSFKGSGYIHEAVPVKGMPGPSERKFNLTAKGKKAIQKAIDDGTVGQLTKQEQAAVAKLISEGKLKSQRIATTAGEMGTRTAETQLGLFGERTIIGTTPKVISEKAPVSATKASMFRKMIQDTEQQIEKLKLKLADRDLSDTDKYNITQQLEKAYAKADKLKNEATSLKQQGKLFGEKVGDEFSEASAVAGAKRRLERDIIKRKRMKEAWTKEKELKTIEENAATVRADIQRDSRRLPKDVYKKPYNPQEYGFEGYNPGWKGEPSVGVEKVYRGSGKTLERKGYVTPKAHETMSGTGRTELPEYTLEGGSAAAKANVPKTQGAAPAFAKELTGRQTRRSMEAITPADDILAGVPYKLNTKSKYTFAHPITGNVNTSTITRIGPTDDLANRAWERGRKKRAKGSLWPASRMEGLDKNRKTEVRWAGKYGERNPANSKYGLTIDEYSKLSLVQKHELSRRLDLAKAGGAKVSKEATGYKIPPELTQTGMTKAEYKSFTDKRTRGMLSPAERETLQGGQERMLGITSSGVSRGRYPGGKIKGSIVESEIKLADGTRMLESDLYNLAPMKRLGLLNKSFAPAAPKGQVFKNLTKQQKRLDETKSPKEWWDTGAPDKPMDFTKSYRGETKGQATRKMKRGVLNFMKKALKLDGKEYAKLKPTERNALYTFVREFPGGPKKAAEAIIRGASKEGEVEVGHLLNMLRESGFLRATPNLIAPFKKGGPVDENWIQKVRSRIQKKGTEGVCTDEKYGSSSCPPGSKRYNLAKTFKSMNRKRA